ncbi:uncharacterized protein SPSK_09758 [Sporothrix schenckii 1099-18]|uniref:Tat pathway signal sequence n=1 Tax=Sporothrix schenckii 1099-18 TaxID=1397361 RepID=A0A0F2M8T3_SPOSC|nr:uncharacterized protein SPSK_09758 [Sporothrix schenckii 1099-18]KJR86042.1 hypothetical protein SPSK_09758 [Sporothrix schenckii 1099-18]
MLTSSCTAPVKDDIEYEVRTFQLGFGDKQTPYQAAPSPEVEKLWRDLYSTGIPSLIPLDAALQLPNMTIPFPHDEEGRYIISLDVFHQLHCLDRNFARHDETDEELLGMDHIDHCVDLIRQSLMCNADTSVLTWAWDIATKTNVPHVDVAHVCKNFDKIQVWAAGYSAHGREFDAEFETANDTL